MKRKSNKMLSVFLAGSMVLNNGVASVSNAQETNLMSDTTISSEQNNANDRISTSATETVATEENNTSTLSIINADSILENIVKPLGDTVQPLEATTPNANYKVTSVEIEENGDVKLNLENSVPSETDIKSLIVNGQEVTITETYSEVSISKWSKYIKISNKEVIKKAISNGNTLNASTIDLKIVLQDDTHIAYNGNITNNIGTYEKLSGLVEAKLDIENNFSIKVGEKISFQDIKEITIQGQNIDKNKFEYNNGIITPKEQNKDEILKSIGSGVKDFTDRKVQSNILIKYIDDSQKEVKIKISTLSESYNIDKFILKNNNSVEITINKKIDKEKLSKVVFVEKEVDKSNITTSNKDEKTTLILSDEKFINTVKSSTEEYPKLKLVFLDKSEKEYSIVIKKELTNSDVKLGAPQIADDWSGEHIKIPYTMLSEKQLEKEDIKSLTLNGAEFDSSKIYSVDKHNKKYNYGEDIIKIKDEQVLNTYKQNTTTPVIKITLQDGTSVEYNTTQSIDNTDTINEGKDYTLDTASTTGEYEAPIVIRYSKNNGVVKNIDTNNISKIIIGYKEDSEDKFRESTKFNIGLDIDYNSIKITKDLDKYSLLSTAAKKNKDNVPVKIEFKDGTVLENAKYKELFSNNTITPTKPVEEKKLKAELKYGGSTLYLTLPEHRNIDDVEEIKVNGQVFKNENYLLQDDYSNSNVMKSTVKEVIAAAKRQENIAVDIILKDKTVISNGVTHPVYTEPAPQPITPNKKGMTTEQINNLFSITELEKGSDGGKVWDIATGKEIDYTGLSVVIGFDYNGEHNTPYKFFKEENTLTAIYIDDIEYPLNDPKDGMSFYVLKNNSINIYNKYESGKAAYDDFIKRDKHKVVLVFNNNTVVTKTDDGYVDREVTKYGGGTPTPLPDGSDSNSSIQPTPIQPREEIAKKYSISSTTVEYGSLKIKTTPKISNEDLSKITSLKINGVQISKDKLPELRVTYLGALETGDTIAVDTAKKQNNIAIEVIFDDGSILKNNVSIEDNPVPIDNSAPTATDFKILSDNIELDEDSLSTFVRIPYEKVTGKELSKDNIRSITIDGKEYLNSKIKYSLIDYSKNIEIEQKEIVDKFRAMGKKMPITITFNDGTTLNNGVEQPKKEVLKNPNNQNEARVVKAYITNAVRKNEEPTKESFMNESLMHEVSFQATDEDFYTMGKRSDMLFKIKPLSLKDTKGQELKIKSIIMGMSKDMAKPATLLEGTTDTYVLGYPTQFVYPENKIDDLNLYMEVDFGDDVKIQGFPNPYIASFKLDWNGDYKGMPVEEPEKRVTPIISDVEFDKKYSITGISYNKGILSEAVEELVINLSPKIAKEDITQIQSVKINEAEFINGKDVSFLATRDFMVYTNSKKAIEKSQEKDEISIEIIFKNGKKISYTGKTEKPAREFITNSNYGIAKNYYEKAPIDAVKIEEDTNKVKYLNITMTGEKKINTDELKTITVNGEVFDAKTVVKQLALNNTSLLSAHTKGVEVNTISISDEEVIKAAKLKNPIEVMITFTDDSSISKNMDVKMPNEYKEGDYTLVYSAFQKGTRQASTLAGYFDARAKLHVDKDGKKTVTFLNHTLSDIVLDFAIEKNGQYVSLAKKQIKDASGKLKAVEYTIELDSIDGIIGGAVLGSGPMGGNLNLIGSYQNDLYRKLDIEFSKQIIPGWTDFKYNEEKKKIKENNRSILIQGLRANDIDVDESMTDDQIRAALKTAKGITLQKELNDEVPKNNVINLEKLGLTDISLLDELGDEIKVLNLDGNDIESLPVFKNAKGLQYLLLGGNEISNIKPNTFDTMINLKYVQLDDNNIKTLPMEIFYKNEKLEMLSLMNNSVEELHKDLLIKNARLDRIFLQENNLKSLHDDFFKNNKRLSEVYLNNNKLESLPYSLGVDKPFLKLIWGQFNNITTIPESFKDLKVLQNLELNNNKIKIIPDGLLEKMIKLSAMNDQVSIDLSYNDITNIDFDKLTQILKNGGKALFKFRVNMNYLPVDLTVEKEEQLKNLGIKFDKVQDVYYPQKTSIKPSGTASGGKITLNQEFDVLEMLYWDIADSITYGGENVFKTNDVFRDYLLHKGRDYNRVSQAIPRDEAIKEILDNKKIEWKIQTIITKNGKVIYDSIKENNPKEGINQVYEDPDMRKGDRYVITKVLMVKNIIFGFTGDTVRYSTEEFVAQSDANTTNPETVNQIDIKVNKTNTQTDSVAKDAFRPTADYQVKDGKHIYSIYIKEKFSMFGMVAEVKIPTITANGKDIVPIVEKVVQYNKYTFVLDERVDKVNAKFDIKTDSVNMKQDADIVFNYDNTANTNERKVKSALLNADGKSLSDVNTLFTKEINIKPLNKKSGPFDLVEVTVAFSNNLNQLSDTTKTGVESLSVKLGGVWMDAKKVSDNTFSFEMPAIMVKDNSEIEDTLLDIKLKAYSQNNEKEAKLLIDWNGNFSGVAVNPTPEKPAVEDNFERQLPVWIKHETKDEPSIANSAIEKLGRVSKKGNVYTYTVKIGSMQVGTLTGNVTNVDVLQGNVSLASSNNGQYVFESNEKLDRILVRFTIDAMGDNKPNAYIMFNWDNVSAPSSGGAGGGGGNAGLPEMKKLEEQNKQAETVANNQVKKEQQTIVPLLKGKDLENKAKSMIEKDELYSKQTRLELQKAYEEYEKGVAGAEENLAKVVEKARVEKITKLLSQGYIQGYKQLLGKNKFMPSKELTRAEIATMISTLVADDYKGNVKVMGTSKWYANAMNIMIELGYIKSDVNGNYAPTKSLTRAEFAYIIARLRNLPLGSENFADVEKTHEYAKHISAVKKAGIVSGYTDGTFRPNKAITRAEAVVMLNRAFNLKDKTSVISYSDVSKTHWAYKDIMKASK